MAEAVFNNAIAILYFRHFGPRMRMRCELDSIGAIAGHGIRCEGAGKKSNWKQILPGNAVIRLSYFNYFRIVIENNKS